MSPPLQEITGIFQRERFRRDAFLIGEIRPTNGKAGTQPLAIKGDAEEGELVLGLEYRFYGGYQTHEKYGRSFRCQGAHQLCGSHYPV